MQSYARRTSTWGFGGFGAFFVDGPMRWVGVKIEPPGDRRFSFWVQFTKVAILVHVFEPQPDGSDSLCLFPNFGKCGGSI